MPSQCVTQQPDDVVPASASALPQAHGRRPVDSRGPKSEREQLERALLQRYHARHDLQARDELARRFMPLVRSIAQRYRSASEPMDDLVQAGAIGLVKAIDRFDIHSGHRFVAFAAPNIRGEVQRHFRDHCWDAHVPRSVQELGQQIDAQQRQSLETTGREATATELAEALGIDEPQVVDALLGAAAQTSLSLDHPAGEDREVLDCYGCDDRGYRRIEDHDIVAQAMGALDDREREVLRWRFHDDLLQREIAAQLGVSQMQVSRIISKALRRLNTRITATTPDSLGLDARAQNDVAPDETYDSGRVPT